MHRIVGVLCALALSGCVSSGTQVKESQLTSFQKGVTTEPDVIKALGPPQSTTTSTTGIRTIVYYGLRASPKAATFIPVVGLFAGGAKAQTNSVVFMFGPDGKMTEMTSQQTNAESRMGTPASTPD
jgi:hypothetical protein